MDPPFLKVNMALFDVCFDVVFIHFLLTSQSMCSTDKLGIKDLLREMAFWHMNDMTSSFELLLGYDGSAVGDVSLFQDAGIGA